MHRIKQFLRNKRKEFIDLFKFNSSRIELAHSIGIEGGVNKVFFGGNFIVLAYSRETGFKMFPNSMSFLSKSLSTPIKIWGLYGVKKLELKPNHFIPLERREHDVSHVEKKVRSIMKKTSSFESQEKESNDLVSKIKAKSFRKPPALLKHKKVIITTKEPNINDLKNQYGTRFLSEP